MEKQEADDNRSAAKEDGVELMIALVSSDRSRDQTGEIKQLLMSCYEPHSISVTVPALTSSFSATNSRRFSSATSI